MSDLYAIFAEIPVTNLAPPSVYIHLISLMKVCNATKAPIERWLPSVANPSNPLIWLDLLQAMHVKVDASSLLQVYVLPTLWLVLSQLHRVYFKIVLPW